MGLRLPLYRDRVDVGRARRRGRLGVALVAVALLAGIAAAESVPVGKPAPELVAGAWINSEPLTLQKLRGRVVLVDFWTYG
jgi:hypothetical protein